MVRIRICDVKICTGKVSHGGTTDTGNIWTSSHSTSEMRSKGVISLPAQCIEVKGRTLVLTVLIYRDAGTRKKTISQQAYPQQQIDTKIRCHRNFPWLPPTNHILELPGAPRVSGLVGARLPQGGRDANRYLLLSGHHSQSDEINQCISMSIFISTI